MSQERDRLAKKLADKEELHKEALQAVKDIEDALEAEFETLCSKWADAEMALNDGYSRIEDMVDGELLSSFLRPLTVICSGF